MSEAAKRAICVGEATIELARGGDGRFALASAGDAFNTAIYLARAGQPTALANQRRFVLLPTAAPLLRTRAVSLPRVLRMQNMGFIP